MNIPYLFKYRPKTLNDFQFTTEIQSILSLFIDNNSLLLLLIGDSGTGKTSLVECILSTYYMNCSNENKNNNILIINNLSDQGIVYFRQDVYTFCMTNSTIPNKKKTIVLDDIDKLNEQNQQIFHTCINKFSNKVNFILATSSIQKTDQHILNKVFKLKLIKFDYHRLKHIMEHIIKKEHIFIDNEVKDYIIHLCNFSVRMLINYLEKFKLMNKTITMDICKSLITNISFNTFSSFTTLCIQDKNIDEAIKLLYMLYNNGYSVSDILDNYFLYIKHESNMEEELKFKIISLICKFIIIVNELHEDEIELAFFANRLSMIV
jgi:DNA polymerase III gamma/tau subunit